MTTYDVLIVLRRRWYVLAFCLALTLATLAYIAERPGVYWTQVDVVFLAPEPTAAPNKIENVTGSLIVFAGLTERDVNAGAQEPATSSASVSLIGKGIYHGSSVQLPNAGGQWSFDFERPVLDVQASGSSPREVRHRLAVVVNHISSSVRDRQNRDGIAPSSQITTHMSPRTPSVFYSDGSRARALAATLMGSLALTTVITVLTDRRMGRRQRRLI